MGLEICPMLRVESRHLLLLKGMLLWVVVAFAVVVAWHYGLLQRVLQDDTTGISVGITLVFLLAASGGSRHVIRLSRTLNRFGEIERCIIGQGSLAYLRRLERAGVNVLASDGCVGEYIRNLQIKARVGAGRTRFDQSLLLDAFGAELRQGHDLGWFVADLLLSLGLLGTAVGFILMLRPIAAVDAMNEGAIKAALAFMSGGMAVALYTTLACLVGGLLLKVQGFLLERAVQDLIGRTTRLTEVHVIPTLERMGTHAAA